MLRNSPFVAFKIIQKTLRMPPNAFLTHHPIKNITKHINPSPTHQNHSNFRRYRVSPHTNFKTYGFSIAITESCQNPQNRTECTQITRIQAEIRIHAWKIANWTGIHTPIAEITNSTDSQMDKRHFHRKTAGGVGV